MIERVNSCRPLCKKKKKKKSSQRNLPNEFGRLDIEEPVVGMYVGAREDSREWLKLAVEGFLKEVEPWRSLTRNKARASQGLEKGQEFHSDILLLGTNLNKSGQMAEVCPLWWMTRQEWHDMMAAFREKLMSPTSTEKHNSCSVCPALGFSLEGRKRLPIQCL